MPNIKLSGAGMNEVRHIAPAPILPRPPQQIPSVLPLVLVYLANTISSPPLLEPRHISSGLSICQRDYRTMTQVVGRSSGSICWTSSRTGVSMYVRCFRWGDALSSDDKSMPVPLMRRTYKSVRILPSILTVVVFEASRLLHPAN